MSHPALPDLFARASGLAGEERRRFLEGIAERDAELARELSELLAAGETGGGSLLDESPWQAFGAGESADAPPAAIGPYRIVRQVGRGGMGRVFLAEQQGEDFHRRVALKVIDRPVLDAETVRRFRDEVRILAGLEHPGIARFLDGGRAPDGRWFLALEYVEGEDLLAHARERGLSTDERVRLFLAVLDAVGYAHAQGVVHRDLKPSNVLVGGDGRPRLLDFGISKLIDPDADDPGNIGDIGAAATRTELRAFTPAYASPEQFRGERATAAADVYSLGVMLYELLAGAGPYGDAASRAELERAVLDRDPEPPSTVARRLSQTSEASARNPARGRLGRDLDAICLAALRKEPGARYASAAAFADDLQRYLDGRPVAARRGGRRYRWAKLLRRHRAALGLAAALVVAALAVVYAMLGARHVELGAEAPRVRSTVLAAPEGVSIAELERRFAASPSSLDAGAGLAWALLRANRSQEALVVVGRLRQIPGAQRDPLVDLIEATAATSLDETQRALAVSTRGLATAQATGRTDLVARLRGGRARALSDLGFHDQARAELERAASEAERNGDRQTLARNLNDLAIEDAQRGEFAAAERRFGRALVAARAASDPIREGSIFHNLAGLASERGRPDQAEPRLRQAIAIFRAHDSRHRLGNSLADLANALESLGRPAEDVAATREEALALLRESGDDTSAAYVLCSRANFDVERERFEAVESAAREIEAAGQASGNRVDLALAELLRGRAAAARGEVAAARPHLQQARRLLHASGESDLEADAGLSLAAAELTAHRLTEAARIASEVEAAFRKSGSNQYVVLAETLLVRIDAAAGRAASARQRLEALGAAEASPSLPLRLAYLSARAEIERAEGRGAEVRRDYDAAIELARTSGRRLEERRLQGKLEKLDRARDRN